VGRVQGFDTDTAVRAARSAFWAQGYEGASLPDLERATGLGRSSIYHAFGSKRGLFDAAVASYLDEVIRPRLAPLLAETVAAGAITEYFVGLRAALARRGAAEKGCLLINTAGAPVANDPAVAAVISGYRADLHRALAAGVAAHDPRLAGEERDQLATLLTSLVVTAMTLVRVDPAQSSAVMDAALRLLGASAR